MYGDHQYLNQLRLLVWMSWVCVDVERQVFSGIGYRLGLWGLIWLLTWPVATPATETERVVVADPYLELHTGPGRGYPIFFVAERGERVEILKRRTDWFKVKTGKGKEGWVSREQMENTLTEAGVQRSFRDVLLEDYLQRHVEAGVAVGRFEGDVVMTTRVGYGLTENLSTELTVSQVIGNFSSSRLVYLSLLSQPFPEQRVAPFFAIGAGQFKNTPKATLVGAKTVHSDMASAGLGARAYLTRRFIVRADYRTQVAFLNHARATEYNEWSLGLSFFF